MLNARKDVQTVTPDGTPVRKLIDGVIIRNAITHEDERGELCEIFDPAWGVTDLPLVYVYQAMIRPGKIKGWVYHEKQFDRLFISSGILRVVLHDLRKDSPTFGKTNELFMSDRNRKLIVIPPYVAHAIQNVGTHDAYFTNMPTRPYNHADPDKFRISLDSGTIPFVFDDKPGW